MKCDLCGSSRFQRGTESVSAGRDWDRLRGSPVLCWLEDEITIWVEFWVFFQEIRLVFYSSFQLKAVGPQNRKNHARHIFLTQSTILHNLRCWDYPGERLKPPFPRISPVPPVFHPVVILWMKPSKSERTATRTWIYDEDDENNLIQVGGSHRLFLLPPSLLGLVCEEENGTIVLLDAQVIRSHHTFPSAERLLCAGYNILLLPKCSWANWCIDWGVWPRWVGITLPANWHWTFSEWSMISESINKLACVTSGLKVKEKPHPLLKASLWPLPCSVLSLALLRAFFSGSRISLSRCVRFALRNVVPDRIFLLWLMVLVALPVPCEVYQKEFLEPSFLLINMHLHTWQSSLRDYFTASTHSKLSLSLEQNG